MTAYALNKPLRGTRLKAGDSLVKGMIACWLTNAGAGGLLADLAGNNLTGSILGGASWTKGTLLFDGVDGHVESGDFTSFFNPANPWSLCVNGVVINSWTTTFQTFGAITAIIDGTTNEFATIGCDNSTPGIFKIGTAGRTPGTGSSLALNTRYNFCLTWDGTQLSGYINGRLDYSVTPISTIIWSHINSMMSGTTSSGSLINPASGSVDSQYLYNRLLTPFEILEIHTNPNRVFEPSYDIGAIDFSASDSVNITAPALTSTGSVSGAVQLIGNVSFDAPPLVASNSISARVTISAEIKASPLTSAGAVSGAVQLIGNVSIAPPHLQSTGILSGAVSISLSINGGVLSSINTMSGSTIISVNITAPALTSTGSISGAVQLTGNVSITPPHLQSTGILSGAVSISLSINGGVLSSINSISGSTVISVNINNGFLASTNSLAGGVFITGTSSLGTVIDPIIESITVPRGIIHTTVQRQIIHT